MGFFLKLLVKTLLLKNKNTTSESITPHCEAIINTKHMKTLV